MVAFFRLRRGGCVRISGGGILPAPPRTLSCVILPIPLIRFVGFAVSKQKSAIIANLYHRSVCRSSNHCKTYKGRPEAHSTDGGHLVNPFAIRTLLKCIQYYYLLKARGPLSLRSSSLSSFMFSAAPSRLFSGSSFRCRGSKHHQVV